MTLIMESRNLKAQPFIVRNDQISNGKAWEEWLEEIEHEFRYFNIADPLNKKYALILGTALPVASFWLTPNDA